MTGSRGAMIGQLLVEQGFIREDDLRDCIDELTRLKEDGQQVLLGELLIKRGLVSATQVQEVLGLQDRRTLVCSRCRRRYEIIGYRPGKTYRCRRDNALLKHAEDISVFNSISAYLQRNAAKVRHTLLSPRAAAWMAPEVQYALNHDICLANGEYVDLAPSDHFSGGDQPDVVIRDEQGDISCALSVAVLTSRQADDCRGHLQELKRRLVKFSQDRRNGPFDHEILGVVFAVWSIPYSRDTLHLESEFHSRLSEALKEQFADEKFRSHSQYYLEKILPSDKVTWGPADWEVSLSGTSIRYQELDETTKSFVPQWMDDLATLDPWDPVESSESLPELRQARTAQQVMLKSAPRLEGFEFGTRYEPAAEVSGDFYEFIELDGGRIGFAQGDVSGHGLQAGLVMSMAKKVLSIGARKGGGPREVLDFVNGELIHDLTGQTFVSFTYGLLDPAARTVTWVRAGHNPSLLYRAAESRVEAISPTGMVVGLRRSAQFASVLEEVVSHLESGDIFLVYTDGVTETANRQGEPYGQKRLEMAIEQHARLPVDHLLDRIMDSVRTFRGGGTPEDDVTLLALKVVE